MSAAQQPVYSAPFDAVALEYDETFTSSLIGKTQRKAVWSELAKTFHPGDRILEIGSGTGIDACFLAERGVHVVACDPSSKMIEVATRKIVERGLQKSVSPIVLSAEQISSLHEEEFFDGAFSNFGALNCVEDLTKLARGLAKLVKPGGSAILCWIGPFCAWEIFWYVAHGNRNKAFRRINRQPISAKIADGVFLQVHYPSLKSLASTFAPEFRLRSIKGIGVAVPPSYLEPWAQRHPHLLKLCEQLDSWTARCPGIRLLGDHVLVRLEREP
jgi:ubiquinone/menaquinone biosynthesis C-methylase UbiE